MKHINILPEDIKKAEHLANKMGRLNNSITKGQGNVHGFLGEIIVSNFLKSELCNTYDYDIIHNNFKIDVKNVFVFHDDMDIDIGKVKAKIGGSNAGHNGIDSIDKNIGKNYSRIRIGIGRPQNNSTGADHVLENFSGDEKQNVEKVTQNIIECLSILIDKDLDPFSSKINQM